MALFLLRGLLRSRTRKARGGLADLAGAVIDTAQLLYEPLQIVNQGLQDSISTMTGMIVNEGQASVLVDTFIPDFQNKTALINPPEQWIDVSCSPYCNFMSETVETGNQIMRAAYARAAVEYYKNLFSLAQRGSRARRGSR